MREGFQICSETSYKRQMKANSVVRETKLLMQRNRGDILFLLTVPWETGMEGLRQAEYK